MFLISDKKNLIPLIVNIKNSKSELSTPNLFNSYKFEITLFVPRTVVRAQEYSDSLIRD